MTRDDAVAVIGILVSAYPRAVGQQTINTYASQIERFDATLATRAVLQIARRNEHFPSLSILLSALAAAQLEEAPVLVEEPPEAEMPHWTRVHQHMRRVEDVRVIPEMIPGCIEIGHVLPPQPWKLDDEKLWVQPGEYGYVPSGYPWGILGANAPVCCFHPEDQGLPIRDVMIVGPRETASFRMCHRCAATYEKRRAA